MNRKRLASFWSARTQETSLVKQRGFQPRVELLEDRSVPATLPTGFGETVVATGISNGTAMELAPDGSLWVLEQGGAVKRYASGSTTADVVGNLSGLGLNSSGERGVLGIAFDPNFAANQQVYLYYTATTPNIHNRISRFTVQNTGADYFFAGTTGGGTAGTPTQAVIFDLDPLSGATNHNGGAIHFGPDGMLYVAVGDNATGSNAQSLGTLHGKMLRINADGTIPVNPFDSQTTGKNKAIWALGLRNPFTFTFQPGTGVMHINDVGQNAWEEINVGAAGANYMWPENEGAGTNPTAGPGTDTQPLYSYSHSIGPVTGFAITGGAFYNPTAARFPSSYVGDYFFADYVSDWINVRDSVTGNITQFATGALGCVDLKVSPDGYLYYLARDASGVFRVDFTGNPAPTITQHPANQTASTGGSATFTVAASGTAPLSYQWQRADSATPNTWAPISGATGTSYVVTNAQSADNGDRFRAVVTNTSGSATSNFAALTVTPNQAPNITINITGGLRNGNFDAGTPISFTGTVTDPEDGSVPLTNWTWQVDYITSIASGTPAVRPFVAQFSGVGGSNFTPATTGPYTLTDVAYRVYLTATDSQGASRTVTRDINPNTATITLASNPTGLTLTRDGQPVTAPNSFASVVGFIRPIGAAATQTVGGTTYNFVSWSDGGAATHNVATPATNTTYTANYTPATTTSGLKAEFFDYTSGLSVLPDLSGRVADVIRTDTLINYASTSAAWTGLDARFADTFASRHTGFVRVDTAGSYTFYLNSDDGSKLWLDGELIINNDGLHSMRELSATRTLSAGYHSLRVEFFENGGGAGLVASWSGPGIAKQVIPASRLFQTVPGVAAAFQQDSGANGLVVMEAENHHANVSQGGKSWTPYTAAGFSGTGALQATANTGVNNDTGYVANSPRLDFQVNFVKTGVHYVWIRGRGLTGSDDSIHVGLDGAALTSADRISSFGTGYSWTKSTMDGVVATINVTATGVHTLNLWMREDGTVVDKVLLTTSSTYTPTGVGPAESPRAGAGAGLNFAGGFAGATGLQTNGSAAVSGSNLRLTSGANNQAGSVFSASRVSISSFATQFDFQLLNPSADGFTFTLQGGSATALGSTGGGLGYAGMGASLALKFDLYDNAGEGSNSTGLYTNGASPFGGATDLTPTGIDLHSGHVFRAGLTYNGTTLSVSLLDLTTNATATQSYAVNIAGTVGGTTAYVGFTGGTGGLTATQNILNWTFGN
jgi:glucose/arabinose dehydrogenase